MSEAAGRSAKAVERAIKKEIHAEPQIAHVRFPRNLGDVCAAEIESILSSSLLPAKFEPKISLDETAVVVSNLGVRQLFELPFRLRSAHEILWVLRKGRAGSMGDLKDELAKIDWSLFLAPGTKVAVKLEATASRIFHETAATKAALGVLKTFGLQGASREAASQLIEIKIIKNQLSISLSLAAGAVYKRGYKTSLKAVASMREDLAAAASRLCKHWLAEAWGKKLTSPDLIYVPFAGSGTLGFESVMTWCDVAPAIWNQHRSCEDLVCAPSDSIAALRKKLKSRAIADLSLEFVEKNAVQAAALRENTKAFAAGFAKASAPGVDVVEGDVFAQDLPDCKHLHIPLNPPYGMRLKSGGASQYQKIASWLTDVGREADGAVSGFVFIPDEPSKKAFQRALSGYKLSGQDVVSGGKKLTLALFRSQKA